MAAEDYKIRWAGPHAVITLPAEIDIANADQACQALLAAASHGAPVLVIDMTRTTFCDSAGVHAIVAVHKQAAATGTQLRLVATAVRRIFTLTGIDQLIPLYPTVQTALADRPAPQASPDNAARPPGGTSASSEPQTTPPPGQE